MELNSNKLNVLLSYAFLRKSKSLERVMLDLADKGYINLLIDSGAFTAYKSGEPIDIDTYIEACKRYESKVWKYIALDVIWDNKGTEENLNKMVKAGLKPIPVLTADSNIELINDYVNINENVCVAGGTICKGDWMKQRYQQAASRGAKVHGLGFVKFPDVYRLPLYSVDSSAWTVGQVFGNAVKFDTTKGFTTFAAKELMKPKASTIPKELQCMWVDAGLSPSQRMNKELYMGRQSFNNYSTVNAYLDFQNFSKTKGLQYFFACSGLSWFYVIVALLPSRRATGKWKFESCKKACLRMVEEFKIHKTYESVKEYLA